MCIFEILYTQVRFLKLCKAKLNAKLIADEYCHVAVTVTVIFSSCNPYW